MDNTENKNIIINTKVLILGGFCLVSLIITWYLVNIALYTDKALLFWIWPGALIAISISVLTLFALINHNRTYGIVLGVLSLAAYIAVFPKDPVVLLAGFIFLVFLFWFEQRIRSEERSRQNFSIRHVSSASINVIIYAFLLLLGLNIYYNTSADFRANPESFYDALGRSAAKSARYISGDRSGIDLRQTLDQYLETETRKQTPNYDTLPPDFRQQYLEETKQQFFRQFNIQIPSDQPLTEVIAAFAVDRVRTSAEKYSALFPLIFTVIILAFLRTFSFVFKWVVQFVTWGVYKVLLSIKFFRISKVTVEVEKLEI